MATSGPTRLRSRRSVREAGIDLTDSLVYRDDGHHHTHHPSGTLRFEFQSCSETDLPSNGGKRANAKLAVRCRMVNLESEIPYFYWTLDRIADLEEGQNRYGFGGSVWRAEIIPSCEIGESHVSFDSSAEWAKGLPPVRFQRNPQGRYEHRSEGVVYEAVRADTQTHVVITGRWTETEFGKGMFIAVFPLKEGLEILLEAAATVPIQTQVPQLVSKS